MTVEADFTKHFDATMRILRSRGLLLGSFDSGERPNAMTIGWGTLGSVWGLPMWTVLIRPQRYSYLCVESTGAFSVNVPPASLTEACRFCGVESGRSVDKLAQLGLTADKGDVVNAPVIEACPLVFECSVVHAGDLSPARLDPELDKSCYPRRDYHRVYYGRIDSVRVADDAADRLAE